MGGKCKINRGIMTPDGMHKRAKLRKLGCKRYGEQFYCFEECPFPDCLEWFDSPTQLKLVKKESSKEKE